ncbi:hypothetical protein JXA80_03615 [bacterium]|nr:hypothetical protein [candidate division CSSED10-310 bacterium]
MNFDHQINMDPVISDSESLSVHRLTGLFIEYKWLIIFCITVAVALNVLKVSQMSDSFTSNAEILIEDQGIYIGQYNPYYRVSTTIDVDMIQKWMLSSPVIHRIQERMGQDVMVSPGNYQIFFPLRNQREGSSKVLVSLQTRAPSSQHALLMAQGMIKSFKEQLMDNQLLQTQESIGWMAERLTAQKQKVEEAEERFQNYKKEIRVVSFEDQKMAFSQQVLKATSEMADLTNARVQIEVKVEKLRQAMAHGSDRADLAFTSQGIEPVVTFLRQYSELMIQKQEKLKIFKLKHPTILDLDGQLEVLRNRIEAEKQNLVTAMDMQSRTLQAQETVLAQQIEDYKTEANNMAEKEWQYRILEREVKTNTELYQSLLSELEGTDLRGKIQKMTVTVIEPPSMPMNPDSKGLMGSIVMAVFVGLFLGGGLALILNFLKAPIRSPEEIERRWGIPVVGIIPERN